MKNKFWIIAIFVLILFGIGIYFLFSDSNKDNKKTAEYSANRVAAQANTTNTTQNDEDLKEGSKPNNEASPKDENTNENYQKEVEQPNENSNIENNKNTASEQKATPVETEISKFTTKIYSKDSGRQNNVKITCSSLNDTIVENGATFSFCNTVGQATTSKGYQKAEIFDAKRK